MRIIIYYIIHFDFEKILILLTMFRCIQQSQFYNIQDLCNITFFLSSISKF